MSAIVAPSRQMNSAQASPRVTPSRSENPTYPGNRTDSASARSRPGDAPSRGSNRSLPDNRPNARERSDSRGESRRAFASRGRNPRSDEKADHPILFQQFFKSVGPRTYAAQVKQATNGNHYIVFTEGRRDDKSGEVRKTRINIFSEDFDAFFDLLRQAAQYVKAHPLPPEFVAKRKKMWASIARKKSRSGGKAATGPDTRAHSPAGERESVPPASPARPDAASAYNDGQKRSSAATGPIRNQDERRPSGPRQEPPATPARPRAARPLPTARAAAGA